MLEFKDYKLKSEKDSPFVSIKFNFVDEDLSEEVVEFICEKLKEYEIYLEYDCKGEFIVNFKKKVNIEMIITLPSRKVPEDKKELEKFVNRHVMDFDEYYYKINNFDNLTENNVFEGT